MYELETDFVLAFALVGRNLSELPQFCIFPCMLVCRLALIDRRVPGGRKWRLKVWRRGHTRHMEQGRGLLLVHFEIIFARCEALDAATACVLCAGQAWRTALAEQSAGIIVAHQVAASQAAAIVIFNSRVLSCVQTVKTCSTLPAFRSCTHAIERTATNLVHSLSSRDCSGLPARAMQWHDMHRRHNGHETRLNDLACMHQRCNMGRTMKRPCQRVDCTLHVTTVVYWFQAASGSK